MDWDQWRLTNLSYSFIYLLTTLRWHLQFQNRCKVNDYSVKSICPSSSLSAFIFPFFILYITHDIKQVDSETISFQTKLLCVKRRNKPTLKTSCQMDLTDTLQRIKLSTTNFHSDVLSKSGLPLRHKQLACSFRMLCSRKLSGFLPVSQAALSLNLWTCMCPIVKSKPFFFFH